MITVIGIIIGFLILMLLVVAHEFGHFIAAKRNGVVVEEFGIGFPPRAKAWIKNPEYEKWKKAKKQGKEPDRKPKKWLKLAKSEWGKPQKTLIFSINLLPIGGFCSMKGESDSDERPGSFGAASLWAKTKILFAGVTMNWLAAFIILSVLAATGMPGYMENWHSQFSASEPIFRPDYVMVGKIIEDSPAEKAGLEAESSISVACTTEDFTSVSTAPSDCRNLYTTSDLIDYNENHAGETVYYRVYTKDQLEEFSSSKNTAGLEPKTIEVKLNSRDDQYSLGAYLYQGAPIIYKSAGLMSPVVGAVNTIQLTGETYRGLGMMISSLFDGVTKQFSGDEAVKQEGREQIGAAGDSVSGPVGIIGVIFPASVQSGPRTLAFLAAIISISLACMNVLPIPALDGGRFTLIAIFRLLGKKLKKETEEKIVARTFVFLLILIALVTILDVTKFF